MLAKIAVTKSSQLGLGLLALLVSSSAFAGRYWLGSTDEYYGNDANWASSSETGSANKGKPGDGTGTTYWYTYKNGLTVFDEAGLPSENVKVGTKSDSTFIWRATDPAYGMTATGKELQIEASSSYTNTSLKIESGTYSFQKVLVGYSSAHTTFTMDGGTLYTGNSNPSSGADFVLGNGDGETSSAEMTVNGGTVVVNGNCLYVGYNGTGSLTINDGTVEVRDTDSYGLCFGHNNSHGRDAGTLVLNGGTLKIPRVRDGMIQTGSRLVFNGGTVKPTRATSNFIIENEKLTCEVQSGGLCFDTAGYDITIAHELVLASGVSSAPLVKKGEGTLTLSGTTPFAAEDIIVYRGSVVVGGVTYGVNAVEPIDASAGGELGVF